MTTKTPAPRQTKRVRLKKRIDSALTQLTQVELVKPFAAAASTDERAYFFKHALIQDTAHASLLRGEHKRLNLLVAQAYESIYARRGTDEFAAVLARHYGAAGEDAKTIQYATRAGDLAAQIYANEEAIGHYTQALDAAMNTGESSATIQSLWLKRGRAYELMSRYDEALNNYSEMEKVARERGDPAMELAAGMARTTIHSTPNAKFDPDTARTLSENSLALARTLNDRPSEAKILWNLMLIAHFAGIYDEAIAFGEQSIALARELNLTEQLAYSLNDISRPYVMTGRHRKSYDVLNEAHGLWRTLNNQPMLADNLNTLGTNRFQFGDYDLAIECAREALHIGELVNNRWAQAHSLATLSFVYIDRGEIARGLETIQEGLDCSRQVGFRIATASLKSLLALTYGNLGDVARGLAIIQEPEDIESRSVGWLMVADAAAAQLYLLDGKLEQARVRIAEAYQNTERYTPSPYQIGVGLIADIELACVEQDWVRMCDVCNQLLDEISERGMPFYQLYGLYLKGRALVMLGRTEEAEQILETARAEAERITARRTLWLILAQLGEIEMRRGNHARASEYYAQAREALMFIVEHTPTEYRTLFTQLPHVRAVLEHKSK